MINLVVPCTIKFNNYLVIMTKKTNVEKIYEPIRPEYVFLGLILLSFFPLNILQKMYPPKSVQIQIVSRVHVSRHVGRFRTEETFKNSNLYNVKNISNLNISLNN